MDSPATPAQLAQREARREILRTHMLPLHGSEELATRGDIQRSPSVDDGRASMLNCTITGDGSPASANQPSEPESIGTGERSPASANQPSGYAWNDTPTELWSHATVAEFLEHYKVPPQGLQVAMDHHWTGETLMLIMTDESVHEMLRDNLGIGLRINRLALITAVTSSRKATTMEPTGVNNTLPQTRQYMLAGEKALEIPIIPRSAPGHALPNQTAWKTFLTSVQGWAQLESGDYSFMVDILKNEPAQDINRACNQLDLQEMRMDLVLGTHLYNKASAELQKLFIQQQDYMVIYQGDYRLSGLKIISYLGQKVIRHSTSSWLTLNNQFTKREPVYKMSALYTEVNQILAIKDDLYNQKHPVEEPTYFAVLHNAVSELIELPQLIVPLAMPVKDCEKRYGHSGTHLLACLRELEFELTTCTRYRDAMVPCKSDSLAAGAQGTRLWARDGPTLPKDHLMQGHGKPCINTRDLGQCMIKDCRALHEGQGFTDTPCTNPLYLEIGLCPNFGHASPSGILCKSKHEPVHQDNLKALKDKALEKYPSEYSNIAN